jgi:hypothetical protein
MVAAGAAKYGYAPDGKRVWKAPDSNAAHEAFYFWTPAGQRLGIYKSTNPGSNAFTTASTNVYFGGRLIQAQSTVMVTDQLGSNFGSGKRYYPYGTEKPSATTNNIEKFTGYYRDTETGLVNPSCFSIAAETIETEFCSFWIRLLLSVAT